MSPWQQELKALLQLTAPILVTQLAQAGYGFIDTVMAGQVSALDLAAVAIGSSVWLPLFLLISGIVMATTSLVAAAHGAGRYHDIPHITHQALWLGGFIGLLAMLLMQKISVIFPLLDVPAHLQAPTELYLQGVSYGMPSVAIFCVLRFYSEALGHTQPIMVISLLGILLNIPANYVFIYGLWGLPKMGGAGCGWATALVMTTMMLVLFIYVLRAQAFAKVRLLASDIRPHVGLIWRITQLGFPIGAAIFFEVSLFSCIAVLVSPFGELVVAAHQISLSVTSLLFMIPLSLAISMTIRTGIAYGRHDLAGIALTRRTGLITTTSIACVSALCIILFSHTITPLYSSHPQVQQLAAQLLLFAAAYQIFDALQVGAAGCLRGIQDTRSPMIMTLIAYWLVALPLGYSLGMFPLWQQRALEAYGFWFGLVVGLAVACVLLNWRLHTSLKRLAQRWSADTHR
ncbi:MATE family efflux transporter [Agitococcus lubricus]|uniref:Multidrug-efflux transporter n=1 Tax=Agitococcus lubricus TaxID=1077255 RepID=A0A2T5J000_9GAMM|nr:MATE family efflux transporter [Agitococcus lubricus]PTQ89615.1 MATE family multidrug resistance protein [Agitococcus lubricus]